MKLHTLNKMKKIILLLGIIVILIIVGCQNAYQSCFSDCMRICNQKRCDNNECIGINEGIIAYKNCKPECYDECK